MDENKQKEAGNGPIKKVYRHLSQVADLVALYDCRIEYYILLKLKKF